MQLVLGPMCRLANLGKINPIEAGTEPGKGCKLSQEGLLQVCQSEKEGERKYTTQ